MRDPPKWRFQQRWLLDPAFIEFLGQHIDILFEMNTDETFPAVRWDSFKAYIRGQIISFTSTKSRTDNHQMKSLEFQIKNLEKDLFQNQCKDIVTHQKLLLLSTQFNEISANKAASSMLKLRQSYYDQGEKTGRLLAWCIKQQVSERAISYVEDDKGNTVIDPVDFVLDKIYCPFS